MSKKTKKKNIRRRTLFFALIIVTMAIITIVIITNNRQTESDRKIYDMVLEYDFSRGRDDGLERRIENATREISEVNSNKNYHNLLAKAVYYYRTKQYTKSTGALKQAEGYTDDDHEKTFKILTLYYDIYSEIQNKEKTKYYGRLLTGDFSDLYTEEELEEIKKTVLENETFDCE